LQKVAITESVQLVSSSLLDVLIQTTLTTDVSSVLMVSHISPVSQYYRLLFRVVLLFSIDTRVPPGPQKLDAQIIVNYTCLVEVLSIMAFAATI